MKKLFLLFLLLIPLVAGQLASSGEDTQTKMFLVDSTTGAHIADASIRLTILSDSLNTTLETSTDNAGLFFVPALNQETRLTAMVDRPETSGKDYYGRYIFVDGILDGINLAVFPTGSLRATIYDRYHKAVPYAKVELVCDSSIGDTPAMSTDELGNFGYDYVPAGTCTVIVHHDDKQGTGTVKISQGQLTDQDLVLEFSSNKSQDIQYATIIIILGIMMGMGTIIYIFFFPFKKRKK